MTSWFTRELLDGRQVQALNIILPTKGCYWNRCYMCSYASDVRPQDNLSEIFGHLIEGKQFGKLKVFTSGSFFDRNEISEEVRDKIFEIASSLGIEELTVESRPEFIEGIDVMKEKLGDVSLEIAIGLESANDKVLTHSVHKGFTFSDFREACERIDGFARKKAYLLIKPPFLTESEAMKDAIRSARAIDGMVDTISFNPVCVHKGTLTEYLWKRREYRPPWLWSVAFVLNECRNLKSHIMCHPVALGKVRGPHNCPKCNNEFRKKIEEYNFTKEFIEQECECHSVWEKELEVL